MVIALRSLLLLKILSKCGNENSTVYRIMPKKFCQAPPKKKFKVSHKYTDMVKPANGTGNCRDDRDLNPTKEQQNDNNEGMCGEIVDFSKIKVDYLPSPVKSENDKKEYRVIKLPNGLTALLISDPNTGSCESDDTGDDAEPKSEGEKSDDDEDSESGEDEEDSEEDEEDDNDNEVDQTDNEEGDDSRNKKMKREEKMAACGLCIGVGSFSDPQEIPGMAHFLEHMVFMGSKKYPEENDFDAFIKKHGGNDNAYTECEQTTFYFEIQEKYLHSALDRFAQFFISPLMKRDAITREREAIESEFQMALPSDFHRKEQLFSSFGKSGHPATKFTWGNLVSLRDNITDEKLYEELHKFRERHYSAHRMTLAIQARLPLETLENYVKECFSNVPNNGLPADDFTKFKGAESFDTPQFRRMYKIKPVKDVCQVELTWSMPSLLHLYKSKPHQYLSWILGHEGKGSLISYLRQKMWALDIGTGNGESGFEHNSMYALFSLSLILTDEGHKHLKEVLDAVYSYINLVRRHGPQRRIFDEIQKIEETKFRFADEVPPDENVEDLCENMHFYSPPDYINGTDLYCEYDPVSIRACTDILTPENANIIIIDKKFNEEEFEKTEPWFNTRYTDTDIPKDWIECWKNIEPMPEFHLPDPNLFVADDFALIPAQAELPLRPVVLHSDSLSEVWYKPDTKFKLPECYMNFCYLSPLPLSSPENAAMLDLFIAILKQLLVKELYPATTAGFDPHIQPSIKGLVLKINGFNQKLPILLTTMTKYIADFSNLVTEELFNVMKGEQLKSCYNDFLKPGTLVKEARMSILMHVHWSPVDKHAAISGIDFQRLKNFANSFVEHIYVKCLVQGNMTKDEVIKITQKCAALMSCGTLLPNTMPQLRVTQIPLGVRCCRLRNFNLADSNSVVTNYYQSGGATIRLFVLIELIMMIMEEPLYNQLRTQEQLGYDVLCQMCDTFGVLGYSVTVYMQAKKFTTEHVDERIEAFLKSYKEKLNRMSDEDLQGVKEALTKVKQCADIDLKEEFNRNWNEIAPDEFIFDRVQREVEAISKITIEELREWMDNHTIGGGNLRKLSIQIVGNDGSMQATDETEMLNNEVGQSDKKNTQEIPSRYGRKVEYPLMYLTDMPNEKEKKTDNYYITNIEDFKRDLFVHPLYKCIS